MESVEALQKHCRSTAEAFKNIKGLSYVELLVLVAMGGSWPRWSADCPGLHCSMPYDFQCQLPGFDVPIALSEFVPFSLFGYKKLVS